MCNSGAGVHFFLGVESQRGPQRGELYRQILSNQDGMQMIILVDITSRLSNGFRNVSLKLLSHIFHLSDSYKQSVNVIKPHAKTAF